MDCIRINESIRIFFLLLLIGCGSDLPTDSDFSYSGDAPPSLNSLGRLAVLATGGEGYGMAILDLDQRRQVGTFIFSEPVYRCAIRHIDNSIWFSLASGKGIFRIDPHTSKVQRQVLPTNGGDLAFSPNGETLYISRSSLYIVDVKNPQQYQKVETTPGGIKLSVNDIGISRSGRVASSGTVVTAQVQEIEK